MTRPTTKERLLGVQPGAFLGRRLSEVEWKYIEEIGAENGHVSDGWGEGIRCECCDAEVRYERLDDRGYFLNWYEAGYLTKRCISPEDREWILGIFATIAASFDASVRDAIAEACKRGLSNDTIGWALDAAGLDESAMERIAPPRR